MAEYEKRGKSNVNKVYDFNTENWYVATDITSGVASQGKTIDESLENLKEALELYFTTKQFCAYL